MLKTNRSVAKRFKITSKGKVKRARANKGHLLTKKNRKLKRHLRQAAILASKDAGKIRRLLPYG